MTSPDSVSTPLRILICQGESDRRQELVEHLERESFEVECVQGGNGTCVETALRFGPHVLLVDEDSTHSSIVKLCRTLQRSELIEGLPVVACVSDISTGRVERLEQAGVVEVLAAPTPTPHLVQFQ